MTQSGKKQDPKKPIGQVAFADQRPRDWPKALKQPLPVGMGGAAGLSSPVAKLVVPSQASIIRSPLEIKGANALGFNEPYIVNALVDSRNRTGRQMAEGIAKYARLHPQHHVADFGGGPGIISRFLLEKLSPVGRLTYLDASSAMFNEAATRLDDPRVTMVLGDIHTASRLISDVDVGVLSGNSHLLTNPPLAYGELRKTLKHRAVLVIVSHVLRDANPQRTGMFSQLIDQLRERDFRADGLRLPALTELELKERIDLLRTAGFDVRGVEDDTWSPDAYDIFGPSVELAVLSRLRLAYGDQLSDAQLRRLAYEAANDLQRGRLAQTYLVCHRLGDK